MDLAEAVKQMTPVFVVAPTARNGITLVQRLLNSTRRIIVYGENTDFVERLPTLVHSAVQTHTESGVEIARSREKFLNETTEYWTSNLWPDTLNYMLVMFESFYKTALLYEQYSLHIGFQRWGVKNPMVSAQMIERLNVLMPRARFVFIYRNLYHTARSAKARQFIKTDGDLEAFAGRWREHLAAVLDKPQPHLLPIRYETLLDERAPTVAQIAEFAGVEGIDPAVLERKINTFEGATSAGLSPTGYIDPAPLTPADVKTIRHAAGAVLDKLDYHPED